MITAIDTNILIDIFGADVKFGRASVETFKKCIQEGTVCGCEIIWVETATMFSKGELFTNAMKTLEIEFSPINEDTALIASEIWKQYLKTGGKRERVVADFLIGAHALMQADRLLTRDRGFYKNYFSSLTIVDPTKISMAVSQNIKSVS